jgi:DNA-binding response OmpR family regulator
MSKKILLAEHDSFLVSVYVNQLRKSGYSISIAPDGEVIISRIKSIGPDLLVLDAGLPKTDGLNILQTIRDELGLKELKVVLLSNFDQQEYVEKKSDLGIIKTFLKAENTAEEIADEIQKILS